MNVLAMLAAAGAVIALWTGAAKYSGPVARGYRWLAAAALFWLAGLVISTVMSGPLGVPADSLSLADYAPLLALAAITVGIMVIGSGTSAPNLLAGLADGYVMAVALLIICWVGTFEAEFRSSGERPADFLLTLLHPLTDLAVLGALLPVLTVAWRHVLPPYLALLVLAVADVIGVGARISGGHEGIAQQLMMVVAACLLGIGPWLDTIAARLAPPPLPERIKPSPWSPRGARLTSAGRVTRAVTSVGAATIIAAVAVAIAAVAVIAHDLASTSGSGFALSIAGGAGIAVIAVRILMLVREAGIATRMWRESGNSLRDLAVRTSDMVLVCDLHGTIRHAVPAVTGFSYSEEELVGKSLADFVHPEDLAAGETAVRRAISTAVRVGQPLAPSPDTDADAAEDATAAEADGAGADDDADSVAGLSGADATGGPDSSDAEASSRFSCRVRAADGTWRHIECAALVYQMPGEPARMLLTARDVSDQVALRQHVNHLRFHDGLTGLPNRAYVEDRARGALSAAEAVARRGTAGPGDAARRGTAGPGDFARGGTAGPESAARGGTAGPGEARETAVIVLDLDGFTAVNDLIGHGVGDLVLAQAARRLRAAVPPMDTVARWGEDEFAVLVENVSGAQDVGELAERLGSAIAGEPFRAADREIGLTASIGVALADGDPPDVLLRNADVAMSRAKEGGGDRVEVYAAHMHADVVRRLDLAAALQRALDEGELSLEYQPVVELSTSRVTGAEALIRWRHGDEAVPPAEIVALAEEAGMITALGDWVLSRACGQGAEWRAAAWDVGVSVNMSLRQLSSAQCVARVSAALESSGLPAGALTIEIGERALVENAGLVSGRLAELRELGVRVAIDDFGTGYAALAHLRQVPVDIIKVDPSFVAGLGTDPVLTMLTKTIVGVGRDMCVDVVAEGIEQPRQLTELREMGCGYGQGFLVARPMASSGVEAMLRAKPKPGVPAA
ncbi:MAG: EAL domain-containing protein [Nocardiopsaceae bacterium]|nr:EAL domain-containing protein [Nocardiopsaceae bacterium]